MRPKRSGVTGEWVDEPVFGCVRGYAKRMWELQTSTLLWKHARDNRFLHVIVPEEVLQVALATNRDVDNE